MHAGGDPVRLAPDDSVLATSAGRGWRGIAVERQDLPPMATNGYMPGHLVSVQLQPPRALLDYSTGVQRRRVLQPGDVLVLPQGEQACLAWEESSKVLNVLLAAGPQPAPQRQIVRHDGVLAGLAQALAATLDHPAAPAEELFADHVGDALRLHLAAGADLGAPERLSREELERVDALIDVDLTAPLRVDDLAAVVPMSAAHFSRSFRAATGTSPHAHVLQRRLRAAQAMLAREPVTVSEVARRTGFADASHLTRRFRHFAGFTPGAYRRAMGDRRR